MPRVVNCPACALSMQPFFAEGAKGARVELDRCPSCTRLWFDVKELETAAGKTFLPRLRGAASSHQCPLCAVALDTSLIRGDVPIEECARCGGALLDDRDFELIAGTKLKESKPPPPPKPKLIEFTCARCDRRTPISEAGNVKGATVCRKCELKPWPDRPSWYGRGDRDVGDLLDDLVSTLFD